MKEHKGVKGVFWFCLDEVFSLVMISLTILLSLVMFLLPFYLGYIYFEDMVLSILSGFGFYVLSRIIYEMVRSVLYVYKNGYKR